MKKATLKDVAKRAGVSTATVSYVLNNKNESISDDTKQKILQAVEELNYCTNMTAKSLASKRSYLIGVVIPQTEGPGSQLFANNFYGEILSSIEYCARIKGYQTIVSGVDMDERYLRIAHERNLDGVIAIGVYENKLLNQLENVDIPVVLVDSYCTEQKFTNVRIDDALGGYIATKYLIEHGHTKIGFLCGELHQNGVMQKRFDGYKRALEEFGIPFLLEHVFEEKVCYESGRKAAKEIVKRNMEITALATTADIMAIGAMKGLQECSIDVPERLSIIGFDDLEICRYLTPGLTTVKQKISEKGEVAMRLLFDSIEEKKNTNQDIVLPIEIIERGSVHNI